MGSSKAKRLEILLITITTFLILLLLSLIPFDRLTFLSPVGQAFSDLDFNDLVFSQLREEQPADTNIVLVNIGNLDRAGIARQVQIINQYHPRVIGVDAFFYVKKDRTQDSLLQDAFSKTSNLVLVNRVLNFNSETNIYDSVATSNQMFNSYAKDGYANLPDEGSASFRTIRKFAPYINYKNEKVPAFSSRIAEIVNSRAIETLQKRDNEFEIINFLGNTNKFYTLDIDELFTRSEELYFLKDKIVLMGYMGSDLTSKNLEDMFFTPLNSKYAGKTFPDMYGIVIHANIISMILHKNYINAMPNILALIIAFIICYLNVAFLTYLNSKYRDWFRAVTKIWLFLLSVLFLFLTVIVFNYFNYKFSLTYAAVIIFISVTGMDIYHLYLARLFVKLKRKTTGNTQ
ncbi:MAG: CHASE2 domain-containing protein [Ignavibacteriaceae bacterium]|nr:CHASE2 domain-containing protein [Ignavibacteriaceae bacterium]